MASSDGLADSERTTRRLPGQSTAGGGRYLIREFVGAGAMGQVYRATDTRLRRDVALKRMSPGLRDDPEYRRRFAQEAERACQLSDPNIAAVYDFFEEGGDLCIVLEFIEGKTLRSVVPPRLDLARFLPIAEQCAEALSGAHEKNIIHCDLKPENIMITPKGRVKILDFGVAKQLRGQAGSSYLQENPSWLGGTPAYAAPEVLLQRAVSPKTDIYSLGVVFYECLTGRNPYLGGTALEVCDRVLHLVPGPLRESVPDLPERLSRVVGRMLAKAPEERYAEASGVLEEIRGIAQSLQQEAQRRGLRRRVLGRIGIATGAAALLIATGIAVPATRGPILRSLHVIPPLPEQMQLAVLPFSSTGANAVQTTRASGILETLRSRLDALGQTDSGLEVVGAKELVDAGVSNAGDARDRVGANLVLAGRIQTKGRSQKLYFEVLDAGSGRVLRRFAVPLAGEEVGISFAEIFRRVTGMLEVRLTPATAALVSGEGASGPRAQDLCIQGRGYLRDYDDPKNVDLALLVFENALAADPDYAPAHAGMGEAQWRKFQASRDPAWLAKARASCERALALDPKLADGHVGLGIVHAGLGEYEAATAEFLHAIELAPTSDEAYRGLAAAQQELGRTAEAEGAFRRAIALHPDYWAGYSWLGSFYARQGRNEEAAGAFRQVVALAPDNARGYSNLGGAYQFLGRFDDARKAYETSIEIRPTVRAYSNLGSLLHSRERYQEAAISYQKAIVMDDRNYLLWGNLATCLKLTPGRREESLRAFREAADRAERQLAVNPRDPSLRSWLADYLAELGKRDQALEHVRVVEESGSLEPSVLVTVAGTYEMLGERDRAAEAIVQAVERGYPADQIRDTPGFRDLFADPRVVAALD